MPVTSRHLFRQELSCKDKFSVPFAYWASGALHCVVDKFANLRIRYPLDLHYGVLRIHFFAERGLGVFYLLRGFLLTRTRSSSVWLLYCEIPGLAVFDSAAEASTPGYTSYSLVSTGVIPLG